MLVFEGCQFFRLRLVLSCISGRAIRICKIRADDEAPGLRQFEASFLRLLEKICNGCVVEIDETGTALRFRPGVVVGGSGIAHECGRERGIGYFLEPLSLLSVVSKQPLDITLYGLTNTLQDESVDAFRAVTIPLLKACGFLVSMTAKQRAVGPEGKAAVQLSLESLREIEKPIKLTEEGLVRRIRGVAWTVNMSPQHATLAFSSAKGVLLKLLADVQIFTDVVKSRPQKEGGKPSPGYGILLVAETTSGRYISSERCVSGKELMRCRDEEITASDVGEQAACMLLDEVQRGGVVDAAHQSLSAILASLGPKEVNKVRFGPLVSRSIHTMQHIKDFLNVEFEIKRDDTRDTVTLLCVGHGIRNTSRKVQ